jgi:hypothetical protein
MIKIIIIIILQLDSGVESKPKHGLRVSLTIDLSQYKD